MMKIDPNGQSMAETNQKMSIKLSEDGEKESSAFERGIFGFFFCSNKRPTLWVSPTMVSITYSEVEDNQKLRSVPRLGLRFFLA